jgi:hypothetical protein
VNLPRRKYARARDNWVLHRNFSGATFIACGPSALFWRALRQSKAVDTWHGGQHRCVSGRLESTYLRVFNSRTGVFTILVEVVGLCQGGDEWVCHSVPNLTRLTLESINLLPTTARPILRKATASVVEPWLNWHGDGVWLDCIVLWKLPEVWVNDGTLREQNVQARPSPQRSRTHECIPRPCSSIERRFCDHHHVARVMTHVRLPI